jgi:hypothetical protein
MKIRQSMTGELTIVNPISLRDVLGGVPSVGFPTAESVDGQKKKSDIVDERNPVNDLVV